MNRFFSLITLWVVLMLISVTAAGMDNDDPLLFKVMVDELELQDADSGVALTVDGEAWLGKDLNKLWLKYEGEQHSGELEELDMQLLYSRAIAPYWDIQAGLRREQRPGPSRDWLAVGFKGLAPYYFEVDATAFVGTEGRLAMRLEAEYELMLTQRWVLSPEVELNLYSKDDTRRGIGSGFADLEAGLRLRYEIRREIAPYIGINWTRKFGETADIARAEGEDSSDLRLVLGLKFWF